MTYEFFLHNKRIKEKGSFFDSLIIKEKGSLKKFTTQRKWNSLSAWKSLPRVWTLRRPNPLNPPPPPNPPDQNQSLPPLHSPKTHNTPAQTQNCPVSTESLASGRNYEDSVPTSYRKKLIQASKHVYFPTWFQITEQNNQEAVMEDIPSEEESIPNVQFSEQELTKLRSPWRKSLIIQTVDYKKHITDIDQRLQRIWKLKNKLEIIDLGQGFYVGQFSDPEEYFLALAGDPWFMFQYHLSIQQWTPNFRKKVQQNSKMFIWAQFQNLTVEYFNSDALFKLTQAIGRPIKMDFHTSEI